MPEHLQVFLCVPLAVADSGLGTFSLTSASSQLPLNFGFRLKINEEELFVMMSLFLTEVPSLPLSLSPSFSLSLFLSIYPFLKET